ncbi:MAG: hypothetical protein AMXMBFR82_19860 [Candidatus Hydrogenedentota bacterium]
MNGLTRRTILIIALVAMVAPLALAEVSISITISGSIEELLPILRQLQNMGVGVSDGTEDPLKLNVHSVMTGDDMPLPEGAPAPAPVEPQPAPEPKPAGLGIHETSVAPNPAKTGESVLFSATVGDPNHVVDTVGLSIGDITFDLFDNGANGDLKAMDGVWSRSYELPASLPPGDYVAMISAYDVNGEPVILAGEGQDPKPIAVEAPFTIVE